MPSSVLSVACVVCKTHLTCVSDFHPMLISVPVFLVRTQEYGVCTNVYLHLALIGLHLYRGETRNDTKFWMENLMKRNHSEAYLVG